MLPASVPSAHSTGVPSSPSNYTFSPLHRHRLCLYSRPYSSSHALTASHRQLHSICSSNHFRHKSKGFRVRCSISEPLKVMICGAPASGKGTQCELIVKKYGLVHVSTGDLLRAEVSAGTDIGMRAKEYMNSGRLVPDEIVTAMVITRLSREDAMENGWLLDGYPRTDSQARSLEKLNCRPDIYIVLDVAEEVLIDRCVGRRLDPETGKIYHITNFPPETEDIKARLIIREDDTEEKIKPRLEIYKQNVEAILSFYSGLMHKIDGNRLKDQIFKDIDTVLHQVGKSKMKLASSGEDSYVGSSAKAESSKKDRWIGVPTRLNNIPHSREIRDYFYQDVLQATQRAVNACRTRLKVDINIPELNPEMDVYRIGTLMELVRVLALAYADDGIRVKVCVQGSMGEGALSGMPLQLAGTRKIMEFMDWGDYGAKGTFINLGSIGANEVDEQDDMFILIAPQNAVGNCIIDDLKAMTDAAGSRPVILVNPKLKDVPSSSGIMQTMGREERLKYAASFENCYTFRLLYYAGTQYPIMGALRMSYPYKYELYKRVDMSARSEEYVLLSSFPNKPTSDQINNAFTGKSKNEEKKPAGLWGFLTSVLS